MQTCSEPGRRRRGITRCSLHVSWQGNHCSDAVAAMGESSSPAERQGKAPRRCFLRREEDQQLYQGAQPGKQAENGAEPPHAPSAPAVVERAEPPDWPADVSLPPPPLLLNPAIPGAFLPTVHEVHVWRKHSVKCGVTEDLRMQTSRQHDLITETYFSRWWQKQTWTGRQDRHSMIRNYRLKTG
ncbi:hypothetical protein AMECASPLE_011239 [Ameca splendens]|uniref:Uncharacterized protein n=1 Tax=Ameca splendens TaxID=208324 RepID=A0ABV0YBM4_9TELE